MNIYKDLSLNFLNMLNFKNKISPLLIIVLIFQLFHLLYYKQTEGISFLFDKIIKLNKFFS